MRPFLLTPGARAAPSPSTLSRLLLPLHLQINGRRNHLRRHVHASSVAPSPISPRLRNRRGRFFASSSSQMAAPADAPGGSADAFEVIRAHQVAALGLAPWLGDHAKAARLSPVEEIRTILDRSVRGVLATHSQEHASYPSGSMVDFACDQDGSPILAVSSLAVHSKNLSGNPKCSLVVAKDPEDRTDTVITVYGDAVPVSDEQKDLVRSAYLRRHPDAFWVDFGDFSFLHIKPKAVRYVSGVATALLGSGEFSPAEYKEAKVDPISQFSTPITMKNAKLFQVDFAYMLDVDSLGFNVKAGYDGSVLKLRIPFPRQAQDRNFHFRSSGQRRRRRRVEEPEGGARGGEMEYRRAKDQESDGISQKDVESLDLRSLSHTSATSSLSTAGGPKGKNTWKLKSIVTLALTLLTSSQAILIVWSKRAGKYEYSVTTANFSVEFLKCLLSFLALYRTWNCQGVTEDNRLTTSFDEVSVYPIPAILYMVKNLLQYYIFAYVDAPAYQILKNLNIISTGVLYRIILKKKLSEIQWAAFILLCAGCTTAQLNPSSDHVLQTPIQGWMMAIVMALLSGFAGVYTEAIIKKRPSRNINVQNFWLYIFGMLFNLVAICVQDFDAVINKGFFHGYSFITILMILNHALSGIAVSMVMKYADNIVKVYSTSVAMLLTAIISVFLFSFHLSLAFFLGSTVVSVSVYLHSIGKPQQQK
ncbi:CMP-sialic acid transporter 2-like [Panicum miliaceum]|uniref:CMP-sialic acid transporter 2-like n=1 Tax=Panicum miliaceum TaxID=4540 RepID=A0A3L6QTU8_PANMI|nr:CMP-sialic acid transporter 2-like [Panicum miliaceum]